MERHAVTRIRREPRRRTLTVANKEMLGAGMLRIKFVSDDLDGFESLAPDDHVKLFVPGSSEEGRPAMRDYTPRSWDEGGRDFVIDFALHEAGPATAWAIGASAGDQIDIGGPRGSAVVTDDFDWYLLIGDETAIPAIARRLEELRPEVPVTALIAADGPNDEFAMPEREASSVSWTFRSESGDDADRLSALLPPSLPSGEGYVWIAAEASVARCLRTYVVENLGHRREWVKASGYWRRGTADTHERIED